MLEKQAIKRVQKMAKEFSQITLDDDYIVKDQKPDVIKIIHSKGCLSFEEAKPSGQTVWVSGKLDFLVLYRSDEDGSTPESLAGSVAIREKVMIDQNWENEPLRVSGELEDLSIGIINSRKLSIRAVVNLEIEAEGIVEEAVVCELDSTSRMEQKCSEKEVMNLICAKRDVLRLHNEVTLPNSKDNIGEIKYSQIDVRNIETDVTKGKLQLQGEASICVVYIGEEKKAECYETSLPFSGELELDCMNVPDIYWVKARAMDCEVDARNDYDEESRILGIEMSLDIEYKLWQEEKVTLLEDAYALDREISLVKESGILPVFCMKNVAKVRLSDSFQMDNSMEKIMQMCFSTAEISIDHVEQVECGLHFEGVMLVHLLYLAAEDDFPLVHTQASIPFEQTVEIMNCKEETQYDYEVWVDRVQVSIMDNREYEVKGGVSIAVMAWNDEPYERITDVETREMGMDTLPAQPGIVGYCACREEELWNIAKKYHTTVADIESTNGITGKTIPANMKIIIVKQVAKC